MRLWETRNNKKSIDAERELLAHHFVRTRERNLFISLAIQGGPCWSHYSLWESGESLRDCSLGILLLPLRLIFPSSYNYTATGKQRVLSYLAPASRILTTWEEN